jgi:mono/diheme cytochrome c family protein/sugar lactone lactonase YvrE
MTDYTVAPDVQMKVSIGKDTLAGGATSPCLKISRRPEGTQEDHWHEVANTHAPRRNARTGLRRVSFLVLFAGLVATRSILAAEIPDYSAVEALFTAHCLDCHGSTEPEGKLIMESHELLMKGGESGAAVVSGRSDDSLLVRMIEGKVEKDGKKRIMPPGKREKLKPDEIALIKTWIDAGAKPPAEFKPKELAVPRIEPKNPPRKSINALAYSPARKLIAAARYGMVELRSAETRAVVRTLAGHRGNVNALAFSSDGKYLFAAGGEAGWLGEVRQWDIEDGTLFYLFEGHKDAIYSTAISPDGTTLASGSYDQKIKLWNVATGEEIRMLSGHNGGVFGLAFRPDGKILASASADRTVKLWDVASGERRDTLAQPLKEQYAVAFSSDGKRLVAGGVDNRIRIWMISETAAETTNPILEARFAHEGAILNIAFSSDGKTLVSSAEDSTVKLWDTSGPELKEKLLLEKQPDWAPALAFALDDKAVVVGRLDGTIEFYDAGNGKVIPALKPELLRAEPRGIQRGKEAKIKLIGKNLSGTTEIKSSEPKLKFEIDAEAGQQSGALRVKVSAAEDLRRGSYEFWVAGPNGDSGKLKLHVDDLPQVYVSNKVHRVEQLPGSFWATHEKSGDVDHYDFEAKAGQTLVFDVSAKSLGSKADAMLTLIDADGKVLASNNGFDGNPDPFLAHTFAADGRYTVRVSELLLGASSDHFYRLSVGSFPYVTGFFPPSVPAGKESEIELTGYNLPIDYKVKIKPEKPGEIDLPLDAEKLRSRRTFKMIVGDGPELVESEPNDLPEQATGLPVPGAIGGRIWRAHVDGVHLAPAHRDGTVGEPPTGTRGPRVLPEKEADIDLFRFDAKAGQPLIIETEAAQRGSPVDTRIEVLHSNGKPVERLLLQAVRNTAINFRSIDSNGTGARLDNYEEMELNDYVYFKGEVVKLFRMPQGPDSDMLFYSSNGKRRAYFDTSSMAHALDETAYIVLPRPPGARLVASGLPVFPLHYANDDDGERKLGTDSKLFFTAPSDGAYLIRVSDTRGYSGDRFVYRLVVREPKPDFGVTLNGANLTVNAGSGREFSASAERFDGFEGEIKVEFSSLPPGFTVSAPLVIQAGHSEAQGTIHAATDAVAPAEDAWLKVEVTASARVEGRPVVLAIHNLGKVKLGEKPKVFVYFEPDLRAQPATADSKDPQTRPLEITIAPGQTVPAILRIRRNGLDDLVTFTVENLPHGIIVDNIGLNGVLIPKGENEREIVLTAAKWVPETDRLCYAVENQAGRQTSLPVLLRVRKPGSPTAVTAR